MKSEIRNHRDFANRPQLKKLALAGCVVISLVSSVLGTPGLFEWKDSVGEPLPFQSREEVEEFLRRATIVEIEGIKEGTTNPRRVLLELDGVQMRACFRDVHVFKRMERLKSGAIKYDFRDEALYEIAAYELGKLLGLKNIPPTVLRKVDGTEGALQAWVEDCMMEKDRLKKKIQPPRQWNWVMQNQIMQLFDILIWNDDRNLGNVLIDSDWNLWMIDHTRAFRTFKELRGEDAIKFCEKNLWSRLRSLDHDKVQLKLSPYLNSGQIKSLLKRQELLVRYIQRIVDERGEKQVLFTYAAVVEATPTAAEVQGRLSINLLARPSDDCFPASSLQLLELKEDFAKLCRNCQFVEGDNPAADFTVIVQDPGFSWEVLVLGSHKELVDELKWSGSLTIGLEKAVRILHRKRATKRRSPEVQATSSL